MADERNERNEVDDSITTKERSVTFVTTLIVEHLKTCPHVPTVRVVTAPVMPSAKAVTETEAEKALGVAFVGWCHCGNVRVTRLTE